MGPAPKGLPPRKHPALLTPPRGQDSFLRATPESGCAWRQWAGAYTGTRPIALGMGILVLGSPTPHPGPLLPFLCPPLQAFPLTSTPQSSPVYCLRFTTKHLYAALAYNLHILDFQNP